MDVCFCLSHTRCICDASALVLRLFFYFIFRSIHSSCTVFICWLCVSAWMLSILCSFYKVYIGWFTMVLRFVIAVSVYVIHAATSLTFNQFSTFSLFLLTAYYLYPINRLGKFFTWSHYHNCQWFWRVTSIWFIISTVPIMFRCKLSELSEISSNYVEPGDDVCD